MNLTKQEQKVYDYLRKNPGSTTKDIQRDLGISCPSARITYMRQKGVEIRSIGQVKYPGSRAFEKYTVEPLTKRVSQIQIIDGRAVETFKEVSV